MKFTSRKFIVTIVCISCCTIIFLLLSRKTPNITVDEFEKLFKGFATMIIAISASYVGFQGYIDKNKNKEDNNEQR